MLKKGEGIILSITKHNDKSSVVNIYSLQQGGIATLVYLGKRGKSAIKNSLLQPLTIIDYEYRESENSNRLEHISNIRNLYPYRDIPFNPGKRGVVLFLSEFLTYALKNEEMNPTLFTELRERLLWFDKSQNFANFHISLIINVAKHIGVMPSSEGYKQGYLLDLMEGEYIYPEPSHTHYIGRDSTYKLVSIMELPLDRIAETPLTHGERLEILRAMTELFRLHTPIFPKLKSIDILEELFS